MPQPYRGQPGNSLDRASASTKDFMLLISPPVPSVSSLYLFHPISSLYFLDTGLDGTQEDLHSANVRSQFGGLQCDI